MSNYYVHKNYTVDSEEGFNVTHFTSWTNAFNASKNGDTITIVADGGQVGYPPKDLYRHVVVESGSTFAFQLRLFKIKDSVTIKAGATFKVLPHSNIINPYTHIDTGELYVGEKGATERATMNFDTNSISTLYSSIWECYNADIIVGDLGAVGKTSFNDSTIEVKGSLSFAAGTQSSTKGGHSLVNSTLTAKGHSLRGDNTYFSAGCNRIAGLTMDNSTITIDDGVDGTVADVVELGVLKSGFLNNKKDLILTNNSKIIVENGTQINLLYNVSLSDSKIEGGNFSIISGNLTMTGKSSLEIAALDIAANQMIVIDNTSSIIANALTGTGTIEINIVDKLSGLDQVIDLADGADTTGLLDRISVKQDGYSAIIKDGDIYVASYLYVGKAPEGTSESDIYTNIADALAAANGRVVQISGRFVDVDQATMTAIENGNVKFAAGTMLFLAEGVTTILTDENLTIKAFGVKAELTDGVVDLATDNAVATGSIGNTDTNIELTTGSATEGTAEVRGEVSGKDVTISNSKDLAITGSVNGSNVVVNNADNAVIDGGSDDYSAKFTADEKITFVNDGHAVVDMSAKNIEVENNSVNTITNSTITADTVVIDAKENADGVVSNSVITAKDSIDIADQTVTGTTMSTAVMNVYGNTVLGEDNQYTVGKFEFGSLSESVDAVIDVTNLKSGSIAVQNGSLTMIGQMGENTLLHPLLPGGIFGHPERGDMNSLSGTINIGDKDHTDAYVRIDQSQIGENEAVNNHTLNVYGKLYAFSSIYNKGKGILNIYGDVEVNKYLQAAGITLVDGKDATLYVNKDSAFSGTSGISIGGKNGFMSQFTIDNGATVVVGDKVEVGYVSSNVSRNGDLFIKNGGSLTVDNLSVNTGASVTIAGGLLDVETLTILDGASFTIDAANFTNGVYQALDLSMSAEDAAAVLDKITITNVGAGVEVLKKEDGDIIFTKVSADTIYINSNWTDKQYGEDLGEGKYLGFNAFTNVNDAMRVAQENGGATINLANIAGNSTTVVDDTDIWRTNGTYTFTGGNYYNFNSWIQTPKSSEDFENVNVDIIFDNAKVVVGKFRLDTGSTLTIKDTHMDGCSYSNDGRTWLTFYGDSVITITNSVVGYNTAYNTGNSDAIVAGDKATNYSNIKGMMTFYGSGVMNVTNSTLFGYSTPSNGAVFAVTDKGLFTFTNSAIYGGSIAIGINDNVTVGRDDEVATMVFDNSEFHYINGDYQTPYACKITVGADKAGKLIIKNNSEIDFTNAEAKEVLVNSNGEVEISDSKLIVKEIVNNGNITVSGNSTLNIDKVSGNSIFVTGGTLTDSSVGTKSDALDSWVIVQGNTKLAGTYEGQWMWVDNKNATLTITSGATATLTSTPGWFGIGAGALSENTLANQNYNRPDFTDVNGGKIVIEENATANVAYFHIGGYASAEIIGTLNSSSEFKVDNGGIENATSTAKISGYVEAAFGNIGKGSSVNLSGTYSIKEYDKGCWGSLSVDGTLNINGGLVTGSGATITNNGTTSINGGSLTINAIQNNGTISVAGGTLTLANAIQNNGTITFANTVNGNITIEGTGSTTLNDKAVIADSLKANIAIAGVAALDEDATFTGEIASGALKIDGSANTLQITNNNNATLVIGNNAVIGSDDQISDIAIKGETKQSVLTIDVANLNGNKISDIVLNITGIAEVTEEIEINADFNLAILNSITIDGIEYQVKSFAGSYYCNATDYNFYLTNVDGGIDISSAAANAGETTTLLENQKSFTITESADLGDAAIEMKKGTTTVTIKKDIDFTIGDIQKSDEGGLNNVSIGNNAKLTINGTIDSFNNLTVGKESTVVVKEELIGTASNQTIKLGNNSNGTFADIDLAGGNNTITLGKEATLEADSIDNVTKLTLGNDATATVKDIYGTAKNNTISVGKAASLTLEDDINLAEGKDTLKIDKSANLTASNLSGIETITFGSGSNVEISGTVSGVNKLTIANNLKNSTSTIELNNVEFTDEKAKLTIGKLNNVTAGNITFGNNNDTLKIDNDSYVVAQDVIFGEGKDALELGKNATLEVNNISGISTLKAQANSLLIVKNGTEDVIFADTMKGNWSKLTINDYQGDITEGTITGDVYSNEYDIFTFDLADGQFFIIGNWSDSTDIFISKFDETTQTWSEWSTDVTNHEIGSILLDQAGKYAFSVAVSDSMFGKDALEKETYSFDAKLLA